MQKHVSHFDKNIFIIFYHFLDIFSPLPSTQTITVIGLIFFFGLAMKLWVYEQAFQPCPYTYYLRPFSRGERQTLLPPGYT